MFEKCQNAQTADLFPPLRVKFSCRAAARLQKFALIGDWIAVGGSAALRISHALWVNNLSPPGIPPIFKQGQSIKRKRISDFLAGGFPAEPPEARHFLDFASGMCILHTAGRKVITIYTLLGVIIRPHHLLTRLALPFGPETAGTAPLPSIGRNTSPRADPTAVTAGGADPSFCRWMTTCPP
ncbi:MAG: hypothetical protein OSJ58_00110 [Dysosmobacter sp.]|nr:hypothetical protein [Dysosmobacter sp.]